MKYEKDGRRKQKEEGDITKTGGGQLLDFTDLAQNHTS